MPFEARKVMTWGPGSEPVQLQAGDEVPAPVKRVLLEIGHVAKVDKPAGKAWSDQPEWAQKAWAECHGLSVLTERRKGSEGAVEVVSRRHPTEMITEADQAPAPPRHLQRPLTVEAKGPAPSEPQEEAGAASPDKAPAPSPKKKARRKTTRGKTPRK